MAPYISLVGFEHHLEGSSFDRDVLRGSTGSSVSAWRGVAGTKRAGREDVPSPL